MLYKSKDEAIVHQNSPSCEVREFGSVGAIDGADIVINGRYPEEGYSVNEVSSFVIRVLGGIGVLAGRDSSANLIEGDVAFVEKGKAYYFEGQNLALFMASTPTWSPEQYSNVDK